MDRSGGATVELLIPFETSGLKIDAVKFRPFVWDYELLWREGRFVSSLALLSAMTGMPEATIRMIRRPDIERVFAVMSILVPEAIRDAMATGQWPVPQEQEDAPSGGSEPIADHASPEAAAAHNAQFSLDDDLAQDAAE